MVRLGEEERIGLREEGISYIHEYNYIRVYYGSAMSNGRVISRLCEEKSKEEKSENKINILSNTASMAINYRQESLRVWLPLAGVLCKCMMRTQSTAQSRAKTYHSEVRVRSPLDAVRSLTEELVLELGVRRDVHSSSPHGVRSRGQCDRGIWVPSAELRERAYDEDVLAQDGGGSRPEVDGDGAGCRRRGVSSTGASTASTGVDGESTESRDGSGEATAADVDAVERFESVSSYE